MKKYYVYEWIRLDTNEPFYVGKGCGDRWCKLTRGTNKHFNRIVNKIPVAVHIIEDGLTEEEAYSTEIYMIWEYRDILGLPIVNVSDGGDGVTLVGKDNPMYGRTWWDENTPQEKIEDWKSKVSCKGEKNGMYGKTHTDEVKKKLSEMRKGKFTGKDNPNYGNETLKIKYKNDPALAKQKQSRPATQNGRATKVYIKELDKEFSYIGECCQWLRENNYTKAKVESIGSNIATAKKKNTKYLGLTFEYR